MAKGKRQEILLDIIASNEIDTQEDLVIKLNELGLNVTQATVSRDVKDLGLQKVPGKIKKYKYAKISHKNNDEQKLLGLFKVSVVDVLQAQNIVVVKTLPGNSGTIGFTIDSLKLPEIVGSVAGDDTIIVITKDNDCASIVVNKLKELM